MMKLEEMNHQLKNVNNSSERLIIMSMTEEITKNIINDGHYILERAPGAKVLYCCFTCFFPSVSIIVLFFSLCVFYCIEYQTSTRRN